MVGNSLISQLHTQKINYSPRNGDAQRTTDIRDTWDVTVYNQKLFASCAMIKVAQLINAHVAVLFCQDVHS